MTAAQSMIEIALSELRWWSFIKADEKMKC